MKTSPRWLIGIVTLGIACGGDSSGPAFVSSAPCDNGLAITSTDPEDAARAIGICDGLVSAAWVYPDGSADTSTANKFHIGHGLLSSFGTSNAPQEGNTLLALSSGTARAQSHIGYASEYDKGYGTTPPPGFPQGDPVCAPSSSEGHDGIALEVVLEVPAGVQSLAFDYFFLSRDYPQWVCKTFVDQAAAIVTGSAGAPGPRNVLLDASGFAMFASPTSMQACNASLDTNAIQTYTCPLGTSVLAGTGFDLHGASGWLQTANIAVTPGDTVRIRFMVWDSFDGFADSSLLLDGFTWIP